MHIILQSEYKIKILKELQKSENRTLLKTNSVLSVGNVINDYCILGLLGDSVELLTTGCHCIIEDNSNIKSFRKALNKNRLGELPNYLITE